MTVEALIGGRKDTFNPGMQETKLIIKYVKGHFIHTCTYKSYYSRDFSDWERSKMAYQAPEYQGITPELNPDKKQTDPGHTQQKGKHSIQQLIKYHLYFKDTCYV